MRTKCVAVLALLTAVSLGACTQNSHDHATMGHAAMGRGMKHNADSGCPMMQHDHAQAGQDGEKAEAMAGCPMMKNSVPASDHHPGR